MRTSTMMVTVYEAGDFIDSGDLSVSNGTATANCRLLAFRFDDEALLVPVGARPEINGAISVDSRNGAGVTINAPEGATVWSLWQRRDPRSKRGLKDRLFRRGK